MCSDFPEHLTQDMDMDMGKIAVIAIVAAVPVITDATAVAVIVHPVIAVVRGAAAIVDVIATGAIVGTVTVIAGIAI